MYSNNKKNLRLIDLAEQEILKYGTETLIRYKTKETKAYKIEIFYQVYPKKGGRDTTILHYKDISGTEFTQNIDVFSYDDLYELIDTITVKDDNIVFTPKKSLRAEIICERYKTPIVIKIPKKSKIKM